VTSSDNLAELPEDSAALKAMVRALLLERGSLTRERDGERRLAEEHKQRAVEQQQRADSLYLENLHLQIELGRLKRWYYGPRADKLQSEGDLAQLLLNFAETLDRKPVNPSDLPSQTEPEDELRRVRRRKGRRRIADFENLPVTTHVHELSAEQRACPCCGIERKEIGQEDSWQIEYFPGHFERIQHVRKKYACTVCEINGDNPRIETAAKPEAAIDKGMAGPGLLSYIVTSKFADYLPNYRLEDIFARQGFEISRATQSVWCGDVGDLAEPLYALMGNEVRASHVVATDDTIMPMLRTGHCAKARMWVYVGDAAHPYNVFDFTLSRGRDGPKYFLKDYNQVLLADAYGGYDGVVAGNAMVRAGCWAHLRRKIIEAEKAAPEIAQEAIALVRALYAVEKQGVDAAPEDRLKLRQEQSAPVLAELHEKFFDWKEQLLPKHPMAEAIQYALGHWEELNVFVADGAVPIDNNVSEREMKRVVLTRKNSLFVGNPRGGRTAAILASLTSTCRRHDVDPQLYLTQLLVNLPALRISDLPAWLPDHWKAAQKIRLAASQTPTSPA
jgi:transposase